MIFEGSLGLGTTVKTPVDLWTTEGVAHKPTGATVEGKNFWMQVDASTRTIMSRVRSGSTFCRVVASC